MTDNRRQAARLPVEGEHASGLLIVSGRKMSVLLLDESASGIGVVAVRPGPIFPGDSALFESTLRHVPARIGSIKHVQLSDFDVCRLGLEWVD